MSRFRQFGAATRQKTPKLKHDEEAEKVTEDVQAFLDNGGKIEYIEPGVSGDKWMKQFSEAGKKGRQKQLGSAWRQKEKGSKSI